MVFEQENFHKFFECWIIEQDQYLQDLVTASRSRSETSTSIDGAEEKVLRCLISRVISHYEKYYLVKSKWNKQDVFSLLSPSWTSFLEDTFLWIGGWRPSMAFHIFYSKSGLQLESNLDDIIRGLDTGELADLSPIQLTKVDELHRKTIKEEKEITEKMAKVQESVADSSMVELTHVVTELIREGDLNNRNGGVEDDRIESILETKGEGLEKVLERADDLRLRTLKAVIDILSPFQADHFLIAAAELHLRFHE